MSVILDKVENNVASIKIQGEFDIKNCLVFKSEVLRLISEGIKSINVNLKEMDFIDSPGIGLFISSCFAINKTGGEFTLFSPQMHVSDLLEAAQVTKYLIIKDEEV